MEINELDVRLKAGFIRRKLAQGKNPADANRPGSFLYILARIPDQTLIEMDRDHAAQTAEHTALMHLYKARNAASKS